ncbi:MAG: tetratricopeptide repeat protein, partial [Gemmataceae bacterium]
MTSSRKKRLVILLATVAVVAAVAIAAGVYVKSHRLPAPESPAYEQYAEAFEVGSAALDVGRDEIALKYLNSAIDKVPQEPAAWANRGLLSLRQNHAPEAARDLNKAHELAPESAEIDMLLGLYSKQQGQFDRAAEHLRRAVQRRPQDAAALFALAQVVLAAGNDAEYQKLMEAVLRIQPNNLKVLVERGNVAARQRDAAAMKDTLAQFRRLSTAWNPQSVGKLHDVEKAVAAGLPGDAPIELAILDNVLKAELGYVHDSMAVAPNPNRVGESLQQFLRLAPLRTAPDPPDMGVTFTPEAPPNLAADVPKERWDVALPVWLTGDGSPALFVANAQTARRADGPAPIMPFPSGAKKVPPSADGVLALDWNNDTRYDLVLAGAGGLKFWQQAADGAFADVTAKTGLDAATLNGDYYGAWAADYEMDGDLDIILAPRTGPPVVLRNNGDGTFKVVKPFAGVDGA